MSVADEFERLRQLHESGALTDEEFARAKDQVLDGASSERPSRRSDPERVFVSEGSGTIGVAANRFVSFQIVMAVIGLILAAIFFFAFFLPRWNETRDRQDEIRKQFDRDRSVFPGR